MPNKSSKNASTLQDCNTPQSNPRKERECLLGKKEMGIGHGKECCCICTHQYEATVCNCFNEWPEEIIQARSAINHKHGRIGWACTALAFEGSMEIMSHRHGGCECFSRRTTKQIKEFNKNLTNGKHEKNLAKRIKQHVPI